MVAAGMACCRGQLVADSGEYGHGRLSAKPEALPASAFTAATEYSRLR
ncbi:MAG TPA: hypothetical protein VHS32_16630 [Streptosporangiaceae bacterium]|nr:hypothetical protein [Streptosporangiaceae bacterium]